MAFFLLSAVLATSSEEPKISGRTGIAGKALLGLWLATLRPLSVYFRTQLTAIVTLRRPAYRIDTVQKLENALDRRRVAPCVVKDALSYWELSHMTLIYRNSHCGKSFGLRRRDSAKASLLGATYLTVFSARRVQTASVTSVTGYPSSSLLKLRSVAAFLEHLKIELIGFVMPKIGRSYRPLRRLFIAIDEHKLIDWDWREPEYDNAATEFDLTGLLMLLVILHVMSCLVVLEVVVDR
ncbi:hypothetical protein MTO96_044835 [Rhipicephalus appendiculatus]